jgi:hypothetical protein
MPVEISGDSDEELLGFTVQVSEGEGTSRVFWGETGAGNKSRKEVAIMIGACGPWALN